MSKKSDKKNKTTDPTVHDAAARLGELGGRKGGPARAQSLSAEERSKIASEGGKAAAAKRKAAKQKVAKKGKK